MQRELGRRPKDVQMFPPGLILPSGRIVCFTPVAATARIVESVLDLPVCVTVDARIRGALWVSTNKLFRQFDLLW